MIPNKFHFIFFTNKENGKAFHLSHYISIKSALVVNKPEAAFFYYNELPEKNKYFDELKPHLSLVKVNLPEKIFGHPLKKFAHKADILRLLVLNTLGGIYMDIDVICKKSFSPFLNESFVLGSEMSNTGSVSGLCNGVMMSEPNSNFINNWLSVYQLFRYRIPVNHPENEHWWLYWAEHSVQLPMLLASLYPNDIKILPYNFFHFPNSNEEGLNNLFVHGKNYEHAYAHHAWETMAWEKHLKHLTEESIISHGSTYNLIARKILQSSIPIEIKSIANDEIKKVSEALNLKIKEISDYTSISLYYSKIVLKENESFYSQIYNQNNNNTIVVKNISSQITYLESELEEIYNSRGWKLLTFQKKIYKSIFSIFKLFKPNKNSHK